MEALRTSETLVNFNVTTQRYIPEDSKLHDYFILTRFNLYYLDFWVDKIKQDITGLAQYLP
jgi:hypothetical protein